MLCCGTPPHHLPPQQPLAVQLYTTSATPPPTEAPTKTSTTALPVEPPSKVVGVHATSRVINTLPALSVTWQALAERAVTYTIKYSTQPGEVNTPPEEAFEMIGISGTSTTLTALERGTTYYIWVVGVSEEGEGPHSDRTSGVTYDSELDSTKYCIDMQMARQSFKDVIIDRFP